MENKYAIFDYSELPIVKINFTGETATEKNFEEYLTESAAVSSKGERYISLVDTSKGSFLLAKYRIMQGKYLQENQERIQKQAIAIIFIAPSFLNRTILQGIFLVKPYPSPAFIVSNREEGMNKIKELLEEENKNK